jgi:transcription elongation factor GreA
MAETFLTPDGAAKLKAELEDLTTTKRTELAARLRDAIKMGDLSENADYIMAKEDQAFLEGRILEIQTILRQAVIMDGAQGQIGTATVGSRITVQEKGQDEETFLLVGAKEADPRAGKISHESPIGKVLMGKRAGDTAKAETPGGTIVFKVLKVE